MGLYDDSDEEALHLFAIEALAQEIQRPVDIVKHVYERELARLKTEAKIKDYLLLFTSRRARETLLQQPT